MNKDWSFQKIIFLVLAFFQIMWGIYAENFNLFKDINSTLFIRSFIASISLSIFFLSYIKPKVFDKIKNSALTCFAFGVAFQQLHYCYLNYDNLNVLISTVPPLVISLLFIPNAALLIILFTFINIFSLFIEQTNYFISLNLFTYSLVVFIFKYFSIKHMKELKDMKKEESMMNKFKYLGEFSKGMSHSLNNQAMKINLLMDTMHFNPEKKSQQLKEEITKLIGTTQSLNIFIEERKFDLKDENVRFIKKFISNIKRDNLSKYPNLEFTILDELDPNAILKLDIEKIQLTLNELIKNAIHASLKADSPLIKIHTFNNNNNLIIKVENNGPKICKELKECIFDPFVSTKDVQEGRGLGLSLVYKIIDQHKGKVKIDSNDLRTIFTIKLPINK